MWKTTQFVLKCNGISLDGQFLTEFNKTQDEEGGGDHSLEKLRQSFIISELLF